MPSSTWVHTSTIQDLFWKYRPTSLLDVGIGYGRWGFLAREQLDVFCGRYRKPEWQTKIVGVEVFPSYIQSHQHWIYDRVIVRDAMEYLEEATEQFEMAIAGDVVEHFNKSEALKFIDLLCKVAKIVILCIPFGPGYPQGAACGNQYEAHQSTWEKSDFENDARVKRVTVVKERVKNRPYGIILMERQ